MNQDQKDQLKVMTGNIRIKLTGNSQELQNVINDPSDFANKLNAHIELSNDLKNSLTTMDEFIDAQ